MMNSYKVESSKTVNTLLLYQKIGKVFIMTSSTQKEPKSIEQFAHLQKDDLRTQHEMFLTERITECLTSLNLQRVTQFEGQIMSDSYWNPIKNYCRENIVFVCFHGVPPFAAEFDNLDLPGPIVKFCLAGYELGVSEEERAARSLQCSMSDQIQELHLKLNQPEYKQKKLIFVYHSFGTFHVAFYLQKYYHGGHYKASKQEKLEPNCPLIERLIGLVELGAVPIRMYPILEHVLNQSLPLSRQWIIENCNELFDSLNREIDDLKKAGITIAKSESKHMIKSLYCAYKTPGFQNIFEMTRNFPKILKLMIYGQRDTMFPKKHTDQKAVFYCYNEKCQLDEAYESKLTKIFAQRYVNENSLKKVTNIQEKFVFKFAKGHHSLHMQKQIVPTIIMTVREYLGLVLNDYLQ